MSFFQNFMTFGCMFAKKHTVGDLNGLNIGLYNLDYIDKLLNISFTRIETGSAS